MINIHYQSKIILVDVPAIMAHVIWIIIPVIIVHTWIIRLLWVVWIGWAMIDIGFYIGLFNFMFHIDIPVTMTHVIWIIIPVIIVNTWIIILLWVIWMGGAIIDIGFYIGLFVFIFLIYDFYRTSIRIHIIHILIRCIHINIKINRTCIRTYWRNIRRRILIIVIVII